MTEDMTVASQSLKGGSTVINIWDLWDLWTQRQHL